MSARRTVGPGFDLLDAALLDLCLEFILPKVPLKALACLAGQRSGARACPASHLSRVILGG